MKLIEKIIRTIFNILMLFVVCLVIIVSYNFFQINILKKQYTNLFGFTIFEVTTGSMSGTIEISDVILVKMTQDVKKDDIITFTNNGEIITHRIIAEKDDEFYTKGDANSGGDVPIKRTDVIGKVIKIFPKYGIWVKVLTDTKVIGSIIVTILLFGMAISSKKDTEQKQNKSFSRYIRNRRKKRNGKSKEKKESQVNVY